MDHEKKIENKFNIFFPIVVCVTLIITGLILMYIDSGKLREGYEQVVKDTVDMSMTGKETKEIVTWYYSPDTLVVGKEYTVKSGIKDGDTNRPLYTSDCDEIEHEITFVAEDIKAYIETTYVLDKENYDNQESCWETNSM